MEATSVDAAPPQTLDAGTDTHVGMHKVGNGWVTEERWKEILEIRRRNAEELNRRRLAGELGTGKPVDDDTVGYRKTLAWVLERVWEDACPKGASALARSIWKAAEVNKAEFVAKNMPLLLRGEKPEDADREDEAVKGNIQLIEEWFAQQEGVCPHCGRGG